MGKGKLGGEEDAPLRECVNSSTSKGGRIVQKKNDVRASTN